MAKEMTAFERDRRRFTQFNGAPMSIAYYNLVVSIRDVKLFSKGIVPHRNWRLRNVKQYFGIKGRDHEKLIEQLYSLKNEHWPHLKQES